MQISDTDLARFKQLYKDQFGIELPDGEAYEKAMQLLNLMKTVYRLKTKEEKRIMRERNWRVYRDQLNQHQDGLVQQWMKEAIITYPDQEE